jgi:hypothetical protein
LLTEWYENREDGLEQSFFISALPHGSGRSVVGEQPIAGEYIVVGERTLRDDRSAGNDRPVTGRGGRSRECGGRNERPSVNECFLDSETAVIGVGFDMGESESCAPLVLEGRISGKLEAQPGEDGSHVSFLHDGVEVLRYGGLKVLDARGRELRSRLELDGDLLAIVIEDEGEFPIHVDPLLTSPSWTGEGEQTEALYGYSVAGAGDVNNDGYSDVIVGAVLYDNGQADEGMAFVYHGSPSGPSVSPDWTAEIDDSNAQFARCVAGAGDVNDDGYSDVIVTSSGGAAGRAYVYHGGSSGLQSTAAWIANGEPDGLCFGRSAGCAGDVNNDGYSDVIVGDDCYGGPPLWEEGRAYVYHGGASGLGASPSWIVEGDFSGAGLGWSVAGAGDVNGDDYSDVIVGAYGVDTCYVYHGSASGLSTTPDWKAGGTTASFGDCVASAGDVNNDGYSDVIIGDPSYNVPGTAVGRAYVFNGSPSGLSAVADWVVDGDQTDANFGGTVASAGDVNNDGYSDVIVGARLYDNGETDEGRAYLYQGGASGLDTSAVWVSESDLIEAWFGSCVAGAGDVNGDDYSDVIVGAPLYTNGQNDEGAAFLFYGAGSSLAQTPDWSDEGDQMGASFGCCVSDAGDVNDDGYSDVIVGAKNYDNGEENEGRAYVYHGSSFGLSTTPSWMAESDSANSYFGASVSGAGDVNDDGYSDVIIGAYEYDGDQLRDGRAFVYHGGSGGLSSSPDWWAEGDQENAAFGVSVSDAGDVNNDGYDDVIIGASLYSNGETHEGRAYVYHGAAAGLSGTAAWIAESDVSGAYFGTSVSGAGDVNGDGYDDVIVGADLYDTGEGKAYVYHGGASGLSGTPAWTDEGDQSWARFGCSVSGAGDVNNDGYDDVIVGAYSYDNVEVHEGRAFVYHGSATGLSVTEDWTAESNQADARFGISVSGAGDVNADGYSDVIVGAYWYDNPEDKEGRAYLYTGSGSGLALAPDWTAEIDQEGAQFGQRVSGAGDVNGDGCGDVIVGTSAYENGESYEGGAFAYYGVCGLADVPLAPARTYTDILFQNYPNPFRGVTGTTIQYTVAEAGPIEVRIFDAAGRLVNRIAAAARPGENHIRWDGRSWDGRVLPSGVYFYQIRMGDFAAEKKMILTR